MPNDPVINNIASMAMQILHEAQGVRDISGAVPGDYETILKNRISAPSKPYFIFVWEVIEELLLSQFPPVLGYSL